MIPFIKSPKTKPVGGQKSNEGFGGGAGVSGYRQLLLGGYMAMFNLYKLLKLHTYDLSTFLYGFNNIFKNLLIFEVHNSEFS